MESTEPILLLQALSEQRWMLPVMAALHGPGAGRFAALHRTLGAPRESMARTLHAAVDAGWVQRNAGYGHPLRPDYLLTERGRAVAALADGYARRMTDAGIDSRTLTRWGLPALCAIAAGDDRFNALVRALEGSTPRALSLSLKALAGQGLIARAVTDSFPPGTRYALTARGRALLG